MTTPINSHKDHKWVEVPPCVYCDDCGVRLYQGTLPDNQDEMADFLDALVIAINTSRTEEDC